MCKEIRGFDCWRNRSLPGLRNNFLKSRYQSPEGFEYKPRLDIRGGGTKGIEAKGNDMRLKRIEPRA
jgi:hypothetical protein